MSLILILLIIIAIVLLQPRQEGFTDNLGLTGTLHIPRIQTTGSVIPRKIDMKVAWNRYVAETLPRLISQFGFPDVVDINREGLAIWKRNTLIERGWCWYQVTLRDVPGGWIRIAYRLPLDQHLKPQELPAIIQSLATLHPSIYFDQTTQTLNASGQSLEDCSTLLLSAKRLALKEINLTQAQIAIDSIRASMDPYSSTSDLYAHDKAKIELCSVDLPKANALGAIPPNEIYNLRPGGALKAWSALPGQIISSELPFK
jgi:hypothetical protein